MTRSINNINDDLNRLINTSDYVNCENTFQLIASKCGIDNASIGKFGSVAHPGISDLDFVIWSERKKIKSFYEAYHEERRKNDTFRYVFYHDPILIPNGIEEKVQHLHTFEGLALFNNKSAASKKSLTGIFNEGLHLAWFTFNIHGLNTALETRRPSLRTLLLIHKNLNYSLMTFTKQNNSTEEVNFINVEQIRSQFLKNKDCCTKPLIEDLYRIEANLYREVDIYCNSRLGADGSKRGGCLFQSRSKLIRRSNKMDTVNRMGFTFHECNDSVFSLCLAFFEKSTKCRHHSDYLAASFAAMDCYNDLELPYPFITPFNLATKDKISRCFTKAVLKLTSTFRPLI